jgi:outer membrane protein OmpA-like peptidoglycan-associated protein
MTAATQTTRLLALLGLGVADLAALNLWVLPPLLAEAALSGPQTARMAVMQGEPAPRPQPAALVNAAEPLPEPASDARTSVLLFRKGTWWIAPQDRNDLARSVRELDGAKVAIEVNGHADKSGPQALNRRISRKRARVVAALLAASGIDSSRITVRAFGEDQPSATGNDRRVEITIRGLR